MKDNFLLQKSYAFALRIVKLCRYLVDEKREFVMSKAVLISGTEIAAQLEESNQAPERTNFIFHFSNANKQAARTNLFLRLLRDGDFITEKQAGSLLVDCEEIQKLLITSLKTAKRNLEN
jgi:four helix bundle protein